MNNTFIIVLFLLDLPRNVYLAAKSTVSGQIIAYCCKSILTIPSENVHAAHVSPDRNYLAPDIGWKLPIPSLGESL